MPDPAQAVGVCGFGRCGSTMATAMLTAGGMTPTGPDRPPWELPDVRQAWSMPLAGQVVKLLDSVLYLGLPPAPGGWRFVWLDRDPVEQARSQAKFARATIGDLGEDAVQRLADSCPRDRPRALGLLRRAGPVLVLGYERVLANPRRAVRSLRRVRPALDATAAAGVVHERDGRCRPDLAVEALLSAGRLDDAARVATAARGEVAPA